MSKGLILVTGSAGVLAGPLVGLLRRSGWATRGLDLAASNAVERGDVRDANVVAQSLRSCVGVIHLAAVSRVQLARDEPARCVDVNVRGAEVVACAAASSPTCRWLILASSREVYGQADALPVQESTPLRPRNVYGDSKAGAERVVRGLPDVGLRCGVLRLSNVYGASIDHPDRVVPAFVRRASAGRPLRVRGAQRVLDLVHIRDVGRAFVAAAARLSDGRWDGAPVNVGSGFGETLGGLADRVGKLAGTGISIEHEPAPTDEVDAYVASIRRASAVLGWRPRVELHTGLEQLIRLPRIVELDASVSTRRAAP